VGILRCLLKPYSPRLSSGERTRLVAILVKTTGDVIFIFTPRAAGAGGWHAPELVAALRRAGRASVLKRAKLATKTSRLQRLKSSSLATGEVGYRHCPQSAPPVCHRLLHRGGSAPMLSVISSRTAATLRAATSVERPGSVDRPAASATSCSILRSEGIGSDRTTSPRGRTPPALACA